MSDARAVVLQRIRSALAAAPAAPVEVPRDYDRAPLTAAGDVERFAETVSEYRARVVPVSEADIAATVASLLPDSARVVAPAGLPRDWVHGVEVRFEEPAAPLSVDELAAMDAVVTGCALGVAATGTIVLDAGPAQGRRALTLVPDHHICVVAAGQIVDTVPQAFAGLDPTRPLTFISGPSATSDIELDRVEGVHGPRTLDVLIVA
ncbi:lactate utilization protein C [Mycobacterium sp. PS03-16]|uniref:LutC/YkgG family protein n=1 Tax=Mycobacterium sp. PS03-16 TaxID=2559611 RepID=UPI001073FF00|nr:LUD domain-containing protein [Mycobacterium sp. PS03-16]TFV54886.1 lactate utilization protein C [Mycobacterium sp. PS03-16]